jgi:hypothetical protein
VEADWSCYSVCRAKRNSSERQEIKQQSGKLTPTNPATGAEAATLQVDKVSPVFSLNLYGLLQPLQHPAASPIEVDYETISVCRREFVGGSDFSVAS